LKWQDEDQLLFHLPVMIY